MSSINSQDIVKLHNDGLTQKNISIRLNIGISTVRRYMKKLGLKSNNIGTRNYKLNEDIFDIIDNEYKAYWLGFLLADGCLAKSAKTFRAIRLSIQDRDLSHLKKFAEFVNYKGKIHRDYRKGHARVAVIFNSVKMSKSLISKGWFEYKKGQNCTIFNHIPNDLFHHFTRGYFDGDGCISSQIRKSRKKRRWYCNIVCKYKDNLQNFIDKFNSINGPISVVKKRSKCFAIIYSNIKNVRRFYDFIYRDYTICMYRKLNKFKTALNISDFFWNDIHNFKIDKVNNNTNNSLVDKILSSGWVNPKYDIDKDLKDCRNINLDNYIINGDIRNGLSPGNKVISNFQPIIYRIKQGHAPSLIDISANEKFVRRAVNAFLKVDTKLYPARLLRELRFSGFSMASLLSVPVILSAIKIFKLDGTWFDPCAGWGNRLLSAYLYGFDYRACDPGVCFHGLCRLQKFLGSSYVVDNVKFEDYNWRSSDFVLTSPPFYNKENYLDGVDYGSYASWENSFLYKLIDKCLDNSKRTILHVDNDMFNSISKRYKCDKVGLFSVRRHKAPNEWFVEIFK